MVYYVQLLNFNNHLHFQILERIIDLNILSPFLLLLKSLLCLQLFLLFHSVFYLYLLSFLSVSPHVCLSFSVFSKNEAFLLILALVWLFWGLNSGALQVLYQKVRHTAAPREQNCSAELETDERACEADGVSSSCPGRPGARPLFCASWVAGVTGPCAPPHPRFHRLG